VIADDHTIVRSGVRLLLDDEPDISVIGEANNGEEAVKLVEKLRPSVVLLDIAMPIMDGLEATREIKARWPGIHVLILTMHRTEEYFFQALKAGASGFVLKGAETSDLITAVRTVSRGEVFLYPSMAQKLVTAYLAGADSNQTHDDDLSPREQEILKLLSDGYSSNEIAEKLVISASTVHTHRSNLMHKLGLSTRHELIQYARKRGLV
jgi:DNA-binding NarL/FixJ family response regulator